VSERAYLDWNATAPLRAEARSAMLAALALVGNPSSVHAEGRAARAVIERARAQVARLVGARAEAVVFTSGATEAARVLPVLGGTGGVAVEPTSHDCLWAHRSPVADPAGVYARAAGKRWAAGRAPRMSPGSPVSAPRPRPRRRDLDAGSGRAWKNLERF
jgi:cysteine desulfurase